MRVKNKCRAHTHIHINIYTLLKMLANILIRPTDTLLPKRVPNAHALYFMLRTKGFMPHSNCSQDE